MPQQRHDVCVEVKPFWEPPKIGTDGGLIMGQVFALSPTKYRLEVFTDITGYHIPLLTIAHECVHISQFVRGILTTDEKSGTVSWDGIPYPTPKNQKEYSALPWEREAEKRERVLYRNLLDAGIV